MNEFRDQFLHFAWSFVALIPVLMSPVWYMGLLSGLLVGAPREFVDQMTWKEWKTQGPSPKKLAELGFFGLGGMVATWIL